LIIIKNLIILDIL